MSGFYNSEPQSSLIIIGEGSRFDARTKLFFVFLVTLLIFLITKLTIAVCLLAVVFILRLTAKVPFRGFKYLKNLTLLAAFIILIQILFGPGDTYICGISPFKMDGLILGLVIACRLTILLILLPLLTETTEPSGLAAGLCALGFNYRNAFILTSAFNLIQFFKEEALVIMDAQRLRGMKSFEKRIFGIKAYADLLVPLMLNAMRKAQYSSVIMDSRAFGVYKTRTWLDKPRMKPRDFAAILACVIFSAGLLFFNYW
ncbi:MAG: energy-coupling factor transporter transmembrane protein EcfT [Treponema sp.]|nr:energy-coupling factor transporter transmembrane protein EcfT [Treponema sp.]